MYHFPLCHKQQGFCYDAYCTCVCQKVFTLKDCLGAFWQPSDKCSFFFFMRSSFSLGSFPWISFLSSFFLMVDSWTLTEAKDKRSLQDLWMLKLFDFLCVLCSWRDFGRTMTSWKIHFCPWVSSTCTVCSWLGFNGVLELFGKTLEQHPDWQASTSPLWRRWRIVLIMTWHGSQTCVLILSRWRPKFLRCVTGRFPNQTW